MEALFNVHGYNVYLNESTESAEVIRRDNEFAVLLNPRLNAKGVEFVTYAVLHEIGHVECGHFEKNQYDLAEIEIEADAWAIAHGASKELCRKANFVWYSQFKMLAEKATDKFAKKRLYTKALIHAKRVDALA